MPTKKIKFIFHTESLSVNQLYINIVKQSRRFISAKGKKFKEEIKNTVVNTLSESDKKLILSWTDKKLKLEINFISPTWVLKDGKSIRKKDLGNGQKALLDSIFDALKEINPEIDDSQIWESHEFKTVSDESKIEVNLIELES